MLIAIIAIVVIVAALFSHLVTKHYALKAQAAAIYAADKEAWKRGFDMGWEHASTDWHNVRSNYERMTKEV